MNIAVRPAELQEIAALRAEYQAEMSCQIIHDSLHTREGWTLEYLLESAGLPIGYGSVAVGGPWTKTRTLYEFYLRPAYRCRLFECFDTLLAACQAVAVETQTNDRILSVLLHAVCKNILVESILFEDSFLTDLRVKGGIVRRVAPEDAPLLERMKLDGTSGWLLELDGMPVAAGGVLYHYNRPYADLYMEVAEPHRRRGMGSFLVQELKAACHAEGSIPAARCHVGNLPSRRTLQKAGFIPCGCLLAGHVPE